LRSGFDSPNANMYANTVNYNLDDHYQTITEEEKTILIQSGWKEVSEPEDLWDRLAVNKVSEIERSIDLRILTDYKDYQFTLWKLECDPPFELDKIVDMDMVEYELPGGAKYHRIYLLAYSRTFKHITRKVTYQLHAVTSSNGNPIHFEPDRLCFGNFQLRADNIWKVPLVLSQLRINGRNLEMVISDPTIF
jgi:hypothetical protein